VLVPVHFGRGAIANVDPHIALERALLVPDGWACVCQLRGVAAGLRLWVRQCDARSSPLPLAFGGRVNEGNLFHLCA